MQYMGLKHSASTRLSYATPLQVGGDPELAEEKKQTLPFSQAETASFSFRNLAKIDNLWGLEKLVKLQLDNNHIERIENLSHMVRCRRQSGSVEQGFRCQVLQQ